MIREVEVIDSLAQQIGFGIGPLWCAVKRKKLAATYPMAEEVLMWEDHRRNALVVAVRFPFALPIRGAAT